MARPRYSVWITLFVFVLAGVGAPCLAAPTAEDSAPAKGLPDQPAGESAEKGAPAPEAAEAGPTAAPTVDEKAAEEACKKAVASVSSGDFPALETLPSEARRALFDGPKATELLTCLAIGKDDDRYCDPLEEKAKKACLEKKKLFRDLKNVPEKQAKAQLLYVTCVPNSSPATCNILRETAGTGNAEKCKGVAEPSRRAFCSAMATGDAKQCDGITDDDVLRSYCVALATEDASRCPKEATDCLTMARGFVALRKGGLEVFQDIDVTIAAAGVGSKACNTLLSDLGKSCGKGE